MDKKNSKIQSLMIFNDHLTALIKKRDEQLQTTRSEISELKKLVETLELAALEKDRKVSRMEAQLNEHIQLLNGAIEDIKLLNNLNIRLTEELEKNHNGNGSILVQSQIEENSDVSVLMETRDSNFQNSQMESSEQSEHKNRSDRFSSLFVEAKSLSTSSSILAGMQGLSLGHLNAEKAKKKAQILQYQKDNIRTRYIPSFLSSIQDISSISSIPATDSSDENVGLISAILPPTPSPKKTGKTPRKNLKLKAQTEKESISSQSSSGNSSVSSPVSEESLSSEEESKSDSKLLSANLHTTFSIASSNCWVPPKLNDLKIANHKLYPNKSGYVLVKIEQDTVQRQTRQSCKEKRTLHYVALLTGEKQFDSIRCYKSLFFKRSGVKGFVEEKTISKQYLEVNEIDIVSHLPVPDIKSNGTLTFNFNFKNYLLGR